MTNTSPRQWMLDQLRLGHALCLVLNAESERDTRQALLNGRDYAQYCSLYNETPASGLADAGPFLFLLDSPDDEGINGLLEAPQRNWGWLASIDQGELPALVKHWRERLVIGTRPNQVLYRFHDNRVLSRALGHLPDEAIAAYLGPAISLCYWQGEHWQTTENPAPGLYPLTEEPAWLQVPAPAQPVADTRESNARRYLLDEHLEAYTALAEQQDPDAWLIQQLQLADAWGWTAAEQLEFLLVQSLVAPGHSLVQRWAAHPDETPAAHFERRYQEVRFWQGDATI